MTPHSFLRFVGEIRGLGRDVLEQRIAEVVRRVHLLFRSPLPFILIRARPRSCIRLVLTGL
jgi:hypothetical protein